MANLVLGPILRHVEATEATLWVETDARCEVEVLGTASPTFAVEGRHYALVELRGLEPGTTREYSVRLDGDVVWPPPGSDLPPSLIRTLAPGDEIDVVFGSCRVSLPHEPPHVLHEPEDEEAQGIDALRTLALRLTRAPSDEWPDCLLMLGDQIYADDLSPAMLEVTRGRPGRDDAPPGELADYDEYALAYREAWSEPLIRWLLATVPTAMIFDDHEIHAQWKISKAWVDEMRQKPWYDRHIAAGLAAYWVYQHLGNLSVAELDANDLLRRVRAADDAGPLLLEEMRGADRQPGHSRWSFSRDLGRIRLVAIDTRAGRELDPGARRIIDEGEWNWVTGQASGDFDHLLLASSVPFFLPAGLHHAEAWIDAVADGAWGSPASRVAERIRRAAVMDHWAAFRQSFARLGELLEDVVSGRCGPPPAAVIMLSGDVHHCYLAEVELPAGTAAGTPVWQAVCSAYRKDLNRHERLAMRLGNSRFGGWLGRSLARLAGERQPRAAWRLVEEPCYENQIGTLSLAPKRAHLRVETTADADWRRPELRTVFEHRLLDHPGAGRRAPGQPPSREQVTS
ncbi:MAG TPA: alkaline phosphatase D family protein [Solirubrobacterales bacterium]|nr:alkaline phosphatase D family protein [Solirubrobacterales bacterium]